ncbi:MAG: hypothetical protein CVU03_05390 [Bacteroidetes bacterium HGW-Bacteroidetes-2]|nr:MAG: hypothetical protein CVU03_05390 [Bacteroidetes bacterium HGW-Bacteroidetes-2]
MDNGSSNSSLDVFLFIDKTEFSFAYLGDNTIILTIANVNENIVTTTAMVTVVCYNARSVLRSNI